MKSPKSLPGGIIAAELKALAILWSDGEILDAISEGRLTPDLEVMLAVALAFYPCSHRELTSDPEALDLVQTALEDQLVGAVTLDELRSAPVPALCIHPAGRLVDGSLPDRPPSSGYVTMALGDDGWRDLLPALTDLTGDGLGDAVAAVGCSAGGVAWGDWLLVYGPGPTVLNTMDLSPDETSFVTRLVSDGNSDVLVEWYTVEGCCFNRYDWTARLHWDGENAVMLDAEGVLDPSTVR